MSAEASRRQGARWGARGLFGLVVALLLATIVGEFVFGLDDDLGFTVVVEVASLSYGAAGALIVSRQPRNAIGWLLVAVGLSVAVTGAAQAYTAWAAHRAPDLLPGTVWAYWIQNLALVLMLEPIPLLFLLFPTGRPRSPRWRPLIAVIAVSGLASIVGFAVDPSPFHASPGPNPVFLPNPTGLSETLTSILLTVGGVASVSAAFLSVLALVLRFRRSTGEERQQLRWLTYVAGVGGVLFAALFASFFLGEDNPVANTLFFLVFLIIAVGIPLACGIAILRHRLFDLDVVIKRTVVFGVLAVLITAIYLGIVIAIPAVVVGSGEGGLDGFTLVAVGVIALAFQPLRTRARRLADRLVYGKRASPYEVLSEFSGRMGGTYSTDDVLPRMAQLIVAGTPATRAEVWLRLGDRLRLEARWPEAGEDATEPVIVGPDEEFAIPGTDETLPVTHQGELLGAIALGVPASEPLSESQRKLLGDLASQAGLVLRNVRLIEELRASRQRLVTAQDQERRRIERNLHDGAQQHLVALAVRLRLLEGTIAKDPDRAAEMARQLQADGQEALERLRDLARGIYPPLLADQGLAAAVTAEVRRATLPVEVVSDADLARYPQEVEAAVYFCVLEALQNTTKYAEASHATVHLGYAEGHLSFSVADDGRGFDPTASGYGTGLQGMADRVEALGGRFTVRSEPGRGTVVEGRVPALATANSPTTEAVPS